MFDRIELRFVDVTDRVRADRLEHRNDVEHLSVVLARQNGSRIDEHRRYVQPRRCHHHSRQGLVTPGEGDHRVHAFCMHDRLHRVRDHLTADQAGVHALVTHRDPVGNRDRVELDRVAARGPHALFGARRQSLQRHVAGCDLVPAGGNADLGLVPVIVGHADRPQHRPRGSLRRTLGHIFGADFQLRIAVFARGISHPHTVRPWNCTERPAIPPRTRREVGMTALSRWARSRARGPPMPPNRRGRPRGRRKSSRPRRLDRLRAHRGCRG